MIAQLLERGASVGKVTGVPGADEHHLPARLPRITAPPCRRQSSGFKVRRLQVTQCVEGRAEIQRGSPNSSQVVSPSQWSLKEGAEV